MNKISFLCDVCYLLTFFLNEFSDHVKFEGPKSPCKGELFKHYFNKFTIKLLFIVDDHHFNSKCLPHW